MSQDQALAVYTPPRPKLYHYGPAIITEVRMPHKDKALGYLKPRGIWVSVDDLDEDGESWGWADWCKSEEFMLGNIEYRHLVTLTDPERLLWITTEADLLRFNDEFGIDQPYPHSRVIMWEEVKDVYSGVVIAPYRWKQRLERDFFWYYGWDCASGIIWDASIVESIEVVE